MSRMAEIIEAEQLGFAGILAEFEIALGRSNGSHCDYQVKCNEHWQTRPDYRCAWIENGRVHLCSKSKTGGW